MPPPITTKVGFLHLPINFCFNSLCWASFLHEYKANLILKNTNWSSLGYQISVLNHIWIISKNRGKLLSSYMHIVGKRKRRAAFLFLRIWASFCAKPQFCIASLSKRYLQISQFYKWQASDLCTIYPLKNNKRLWTKIQGSNTIWIWHKIFRLTFLKISNIPQIWYQFISKWCEC